MGKIIHKIEWINRAISGLSLLKGKQRNWLNGMSKEDIHKWAENEYNRHFNK